MLNVYSFKCWQIFSITMIDYLFANAFFLFSIQMKNDREEEVEEKFCRHRFFAHLIF